MIGSEEYQCLEMVTKDTEDLGLGALRKVRAEPAASQVGRALFGVVDPRVCSYVFLSLFTKDNKVKVRTLDEKTGRTMFMRGGPGTVRYIGRGLGFAHLRGGKLALAGSIVGTLCRLRNRGIFSFMFVSPPCGVKFRGEILRCLTKSSLVCRSAIVVMRTSLSASFKCLPRLKCSLVGRGECGAGGRMFVRGTKGRRMYWGRFVQRILAPLPISVVVSFTSLMGS